MKDAFTKGLIEINNKNQALKKISIGKLNRFNMFDTQTTPECYRDESFIQSALEDIAVSIFRPDNSVLLITTIIAGLVLLNLSKYLWAHSTTGFIVLIAILFFYVFFVYLELLFENIIMVSVFLPIYIIFLAVAVHPKVIWLLGAILLWLIIFRCIVVFFRRKYSRDVIKIKDVIHLNDNKIIESIRSNIMSIAKIKGIVDIESIKKDGLEYVDDRYIQIVLNDAVEKDILEEFFIFVKDKNTKLYRANNSMVSQVMEID